MRTLYELKDALNSCSMQMSSDWIPVNVDGKEIDSVELIKKNEEWLIEIKTKLS